MKLITTFFLIFSLLSCSFKQESGEKAQGFFFKPHIQDASFSCDTKPLVFIDSFSNIFIKDLSLNIYGVRGCRLVLSFKKDSSGYILKESLTCQGDCEIPIHFYSPLFPQCKPFCEEVLSCHKLDLLKLEKLDFKGKRVSIDFLVQKQSHLSYGPLYQSCQLKVKKMDF